MAYTYTINGNATTPTPGDNVICRLKGANGAAVTARNVRIEEDPTHRLGIQISCDSGGDVLVENCDIGPMRQDAYATSTGKHLDLIQINGLNGQNVTVRNCKLHDTSGLVATLHIVDGYGVAGRAGIVTLDNIQTWNCARSIEIGGKVPIQRLIIRNCKNISVVSGGTGATPKPEWEGDCTGSVVYGQRQPGAIVPPQPQPTGPTVAELQAQLAAEQERAALLAGQVQTLTETVRALTDNGALNKSAVQSVVDRWR